MKRTDKFVNAQVPASVSNALYARADEKMQQAASMCTITDHLHRSAGAIRVLAAHVASVSLDDPRLHGLAKVMGALRDPGDPTVHFGPQQTRLIETLGSTDELVLQQGAAVDADAALTALVSAGAEDVAAALHSTREALSFELRRLREAQDELRQRANRADDLEAQRSEERSLFESQLRQAARGQWQEAQRDPFAERREQAMQEERQHFVHPEPAATRPVSDRVKVEEGIYSRRGKFQAIWRDEDGKQRSESFDTIEQAREARQARAVAA